MTKTHRLPIILITILFLLIGCEKTSDPDPPEHFGDSLNEQDNAYLESVSIPNPALNQMIGYDGNPLGRIMKADGIAQLIDGMLRDAQSLSGQKILKYAKEGKTGPEHLGLVYSKGQRNISQRLHPTLGDSIHKKYAVYGTDCSGFIYNLIRHAGLNIENFRVDNFEDKLNNALKKSSIYKDIKVRKFTNIPEDKIRNGDFVLWIRGVDNNHMGIAYKYKNNPAVGVFQSNGTGSPGSENKQTENLGPTRVVHPISLSVMLFGKGYWGTGYIILRLESGFEEKIIGKWNWDKIEWNNYYENTSHVSSDSRPGEFIEFKSDKTAFINAGGKSGLTNWALIDTTKIKIEEGVYEMPRTPFEIKTLAKNEMILYAKDVAGATYVETTLFLKK